MTVYVDLVFLINFLFDFLLLLTVNVALKRYVRIYRLLLGSLFGSITLISLFIAIPSFLLTILKLVMGILMCLLAFGYKNIKYTFYNVLYLYMCSIILGGFVYYLNIEFKNMPYLLLLILGPLILYVFIKSRNVLKEVKDYYYPVEITFQNNYELKVVGFLDTGNKMRDPITKKAVIILNKKLIKGHVNIRSPMYVAYHTVSSHDLMECIKPKKLIIGDKEYSNYLIGFSDHNFKLNGINCLLNYQILED